MRTIASTFALLVMLSLSCTEDGRQLFRTGPSAGVEAETESHRSRFQLERAQDAARWLLANRVKQGMSPADVAEIFGEQGERVYEDEWLKSGAGQYQVGDETYKWGPDDRGTSYYLMFRGGRLANFDADQFR
jgi:hypothetical protein